MRFHNSPVEGYTSIIVFLSLAFGILFILLGIIGEYIGKIFMELKDKPIYIIDYISTNDKN